MDLILGIAGLILWAFAVGVRREIEVSASRQSGTATTDETAEVAPTKESVITAFKRIYSKDGIFRALSLLFVVGVAAKAVVTYLLRRHVMTTIEEWTVAERRIAVLAGLAVLISWSIISLIAVKVRANHRVMGNVYAGAAVLWIYFGVIVLSLSMIVTGN